MQNLAIGSARLELVQGDIAQEATEALVNAANSHLAGGGGVDGAIHRAGGPAIMKELKARYSGCPTGSAVITGGGNLKAKYVIHAVGPRYGGRPQDAALLQSAYETSLMLCLEHGIKTVALPSISTGIYGYPAAEAAPVALGTVSHFLRKRPQIVLARFVLFDKATFQAYAAALENLREIS